MDLKLEDEDAEEEQREDNSSALRPLLQERGSDCLEMCLQLLTDSCPDLVTLNLRTSGRQPVRSLLACLKRDLFSEHCETCVW